MKGVALQYSIPTIQTFQIALLGASWSLKKEQLYGIPQGSILSLMLFNIYVKYWGKSSRYLEQSTISTLVALKCISCDTAHGVAHLNVGLQTIMA